MKQDLGKTYNMRLVRNRPTQVNKPIRTRYLDHVTGYQPIRDQYFLIQSVLETLLTPWTSKQPIRTRYLGHVTGYQPIMDQYFMLPDLKRRFTVETDVIRKYWSLIGC
eukprot:sb/3477621/